MDCCDEDKIPVGSVLIPLWAGVFVRQSKACLMLMSRIGRLCVFVQTIATDNGSVLRRVDKELFSILLL